jgi:hypothetical protein
VWGQPHGETRDPTPLNFSSQGHLPAGCGPWSAATSVRRVSSSHARDAEGKTQLGGTAHGRARPSLPRSCETPRLSTGRHSERTRVDLLVLVVLSHGGPLPRVVLGRSPEYLPHGRSQAGDRRLQNPRGPGQPPARAREKSKSRLTGTPSTAAPDSSLTRRGRASSSMSVATRSTLRASPPV